MQLFVLSHGSMLFFVFFFKQKTAYEMRISDWSSDVCSSDLLPAPLSRTRGAHVDEQPVDRFRRVERRRRDPDREGAVAGAAQRFLDAPACRAARLARVHRRT